MFCSFVADSVSESEIGKYLKFNSIEGIVYFNRTYAPLITLKQILAQWIMEVCSGQQQLQLSMFTAWFTDSNLVV